MEILNAQSKTTYAVCSGISKAAASRLDNWEKLMAFNETYIYLQELKREGIIKEGMNDKIFSLYLYLIIPNFKV